MIVKPKAPLKIQNKPYFQPLTGIFRIDRKIYTHNLNMYMACMKSKKNPKKVFRIRI